MTAIKMLFQATIAASVASFGVTAARVADQGKPAPDIELRSILNAPEGTEVSLLALRGKVVVLEFWATTCAPCVASIPAMNEFEARFTDDPVVFLHVTKQEESLVTKFLAHRPIRGWIGIDDDGKTSKNYGVRGLPALVVIGKGGTLLGWSDPRVLSREPEILKEVLATGSSGALSQSKPTSDDPLAGIERDDATGRSGQNLCDIVIRRSGPNSEGQRSGGDGRGRWSFDQPLLNHIGTFCKFPAVRIVSPTELPNDHYDIIIKSQSGPTPAMMDAACRLIGATFDLSLTRKKRVVDVYVLKTLPARKPTLTPSWGGVYTDEETGINAPSREVLDRMKAGDNFFFALCPLPWLPDRISIVLNKPVVAELGVLPETSDGVYSICFPYPKGDIEAFRKTFEEQVGLTLVPGKREVEVLVVEPK